MEKHTRNFPWSLLAMDFLGALLVAWGFYRYVSANEGAGFIIAGFLLMTPFALHLVNRAKGSNKRKGQK